MTQNVENTPIENPNFGGQILTGTRHTLALTLMAPTSLRDFGSTAFKGGKLSVDCPFSSGGLDTLGIGSQSRYVWRGDDADSVLQPEYEGAVGGSLYGFKCIQPDARTDCLRMSCWDRRFRHARKPISYSIRCVADKKDGVRTVDVVDADG